MNKTHIIITLLLLCTSPHCLTYARSLNPQDFGNIDNLLGEQELVEFFIIHQNITYKKVWELDPEKLPPSWDRDDEYNRKKFLVEPDLDEMKAKFMDSGPYTPIQVQAYIENTTVEEILSRTTPEPPGEKKSWNVATPKIRQKVEDWNKKPNVDGVTINDLNDNHSWTTSGSIILPVTYYTDSGLYRNESYSNRAFLPAIRWNYYDISDDDSKKKEELTLQLPLYARIAHKIIPRMDKATGEPVEPVGLASWSSEYYFTPFYTTDFDFNGEIIGINLTYEPIIHVGKGFQTGSWHKFSRTGTTAYLLRLIPGVTYSHVLTEGNYFNREENDDNFGPLVSLELGLKPFGINGPWEVKASYEMYYDFTGDDDGYFDKYGGSLSYWISENTAMTLKYTDGDNFLSKQMIDQLSLGLQVRF